MLVLASWDARADQAAFAAAGLDTYAPFDFSRQARLPDGSEVTVSFSLAFVTDRAMPEAVFFACQQHAPEYFWKPEFQRHANGAIEIAETIMVAHRPADLADFFRRLQGGPAVKPSGAGLTVEAGTSTISVMDPRAFADRFAGPRIDRAPDTPYLAAYRLRVADLDRCAQVMSARGAAYARDGKVLRISPDLAFNVAIEFVAD